MQGSIDDAGEYFIQDGTELKFKLTKHQEEIIGNYLGKKVTLAVRAEYVYIDDAHLAENKESQFTINVDYTEYLGAYNLIYGFVGEEAIISKVYNRQEITEKEIKACFDMSKVHFFDIETTKRIR
jgi:multiple sugar transport system ATP-binding protein